MVGGIREEKEGHANKPQYYKEKKYIIRKQNCSNRNPPLLTHNTKTKQKNKIKNRKKKTNKHKKLKATVISLPVALHNQGISATEL